MAPWKSGQCGFNPIYCKQEHRVVVGITFGYIPLYHYIIISPNISPLYDISPDVSIYIMRYWDITIWGSFQRHLGPSMTLVDFWDVRISRIAEKRGWEISELTGDFRWENHRTIGGVSSKPCDWLLEGTYHDGFRGVMPGSGFVLRIVNLLNHWPRGTQTDLLKPKLKMMLDSDRSIKLKGSMIWYISAIFSPESF